MASSLQDAVRGSTNATTAFLPRKIGKGFVSLMCNRLYYLFRKIAKWDQANCISMQRWSDLGTNLLLSETSYSSLEIFFCINEKNSRDSVTDFNLGIHLLVFCYCQCFREGMYELTLLVCIIIPLFKQHSGNFTTNSLIFMNTCVIKKDGVVSP